MSGGHFSYDQYKIGYIADEVEQLIVDNGKEDKNEWGDNLHNRFTDDTITEFKTALDYLRRAQIYAQRIDWLVSGDDGEDSFHTRLNKDLWAYFKTKEGTE